VLLIPSFLLCVISRHQQHESKDHTTSLASSNHPVASEVARESDDVKSQLHAELTDIREALRQAEDKIHQLSSHHEEAVLENDRLHSQLEREKQAMIDLQLQASEQTSSRDHTIGSLQHQYRILEDAHKKNLDTLKQYEHYHRETQREMAAMAKERDQAVAKSLKLDAFDNSIDRVSEAQLVGEVRDVNTAIDDFVTALLEDATSVSEGASPASSDVLMTDVDHSEFFHMSLRVSPDSEAWGLLLDSLMHQKVLEHVHQVFLSTSFGIPEEGKLGESLLQLEHEVNKNGDFLFNSGSTSTYLLNHTETWRAAQRWRAMTATACFSSANSRIKTTHVAGIGHELRECLTIALRKPSNALDNMKEDIENKLVRIFEAAQHVGASASKGVVSARVRVILGSEHPTVVDNIWSDMGSVANDSIMGDYSFGLMKVGEQGQTSVLMRPKVTTQSLIRYVSKLEHP
jgi:hypothetical protein